MTDQISIQNVTIDEFDGQAVQVLLPPHAQIIEHHDLVALFQQEPHQGCPDEPRTTCDQNSHRSSVLVVDIT